MKQQFTHILQKVGILKTFTVAKLVDKKELDDLKSLVKSVSSNEEEYKKLLTEELNKLSSTHDKKNPIPGIIYEKSDELIDAIAQKKIFYITKKFSQAVEQCDFSKLELTFLIVAIISATGLTQRDFENLRSELNDDSDEESEEYDDDGDEDDEDSDERYT